MARAAQLDRCQVLQCGCHNPRADPVEPYVVIHPRKHRVVLLVEEVHLLAPAHEVPTQAQRAIPREPLASVGRAGVHGAHHGHIRCLGSRERAGDHLAVLAHKVDRAEAQNRRQPGLAVEQHVSSPVETYEVWYVCWRGFQAG